MVPQDLARSEEPGPKREAGQEARLTQTSTVVLGSGEHF